MAQSPRHKALPQRGPLPGPPDQTTVPGQSPQECWKVLNNLLAEQSLTVALISVVEALTMANFKEPP